ncbi:hypothetical protein MAPG_09109 [Magnaporthiopsis poae ATCC 64411]|uniref:DUF7136 domain-containing protein n=1 Tax=Magnaporthiopsis poae (strain ATCC 64411 / 73-15) TaxID=644358 RepID=A0A0C4E932_MAGP6|nr:hypothetical protein MAPG_09109 [Magnaporthiopsis poae ATCC 64411]
MRILSLLALAPVAASLANAEQQSHVDVQFDLVFPRHNETYAPTQLFPIVFAMQNADGILPTLRTDGFRVSLGVWTDDWRSPRRNRSLGSWGFARKDFFSRDFEAAAIPVPAARFAHLPPINMTNGTTGTYYLAWNIFVSNKCHPPGEKINNSTWGYSGGIHFSTAPGAQLPDIEASLNSCPEPDASSSIGLNVKTFPSDEGCPAFLGASPPIKCGYKPFAKDLAANVSAAMLRKMGCEEGTWQTITAPCPSKPKPNGASFVAATSWAVWTAWLLVMASAF